MIELGKRLDSRRFRVHVACLHKRGAWLSRAADDPARIAEFPVASFRRIEALTELRRLARWCRARRIAVLHAADLYANIFALPAAAAARVPVRIGNRREINPDKSPGLIALQRIAYGFAHRVVANSTAVADRLRREGLTPRKISIVPNGVELAAYQLHAGSPRLRRIVTVANLRAEKAHETLITAAARLLSIRPEAEFWIVGGGARLQELTALADRLGIGGRVRFLGHRDDVPALLSESDIFVLTSRSEGFPNSVIEAMAAGLPVVATGVGGVVELIEHERNGLLVAPGDSDAVAEALLGLMERPERAAALGRAARLTVEGRFTFDLMVRRFEEIYLDLLDRRASRATTAQPIAS
jgi:glycosyltransferase involved in cell wall biosynthesis